MVGSGFLGVRHCASLGNPKAAPVHSHSRGRFDPKINAFFSNPLQRVSQRQASLKARNELLQCLKLDSNDNKIRISQIVAQLVSTGSPFDERLLGGGPWMVVYTEGVFLWQIYTSPGKILLGKKNVASQSFNPITKGVLNSGEIAKSDCYVTAVGKYQQTQDNRTHLPVDIEVEVSSGILHIFDRKIPLPIKGRGKFTVCYLDDTLRIFRSQGRGLSVQVKQSYFLDHRLGLE